MYLTVAPLVDDRPRTKRRNRPCPGCPWMTPAIARSALVHNGTLIIFGLCALAVTKRTARGGTKGAEPLHHSPGIKFAGRHTPSPLDQVSSFGLKPVGCCESDRTIIITLRSYSGCAPRAHTSNYSHPKSITPSHTDNLPQKRLQLKHPGIGALYLTFLVFCIPP